ncbi:MAG: diguanylate cyclase [Pseudomonadota bacterium]
MQYHKSLWLTGLLLFVLSCLAIEFVADIERSRIEQLLRTRVSDDTARLVSQLEKELNANVYLVSGLVAYIYAEPELREDRIQIALKALYEFGSHLRNVAAAPNNEIAYIYPLEGNERAIGLKYQEVPLQWPAVKRAMDSRQTVVSGPIELVQGGSGLVSRTPVFLTDGSYWGILSLVMDYDSLIASAGIAPEARFVKMAIRSFEDGTETGRPIMGDQELFTNNSVIQSIAIPGGEWQLAAMPTNGWQARQSFVAKIEAVAIAAALCFILGFLRIQHIQRRITAAKNRMEAILETTQEAIIVFDDAGLISESNAAAENLFGYSRTELQNMNVKTFMRKTTDSGEGTCPLLEISSDHSQHLSDIEAVKQSGAIIPLEINIGHTVIDGMNKHICAARDVSVRKAAERVLMEQATTDELTGVMNRRSVLKSASEIFAIARRHERPLSVVMIDADNFKQINDTYGHDAGDKVLIALTACIADDLRTSDLFGRFGGEEFIVVMPEAAIDEATVAAKRMLERIRALRVTVSSRQIRFTVSIGISSMNDEATELKELIHMADTALYAAKHAGRDRYFVSVPAGQAPMENNPLHGVDTALHDNTTPFKKKVV